MSARSYPSCAFGPVFIEVQKQVPPAWPQFTATMNAPCAPRLIVRIDVQALQEHAILNGDRVQLARAHGEKRIALGRLRRLGDLQAVRVRSARHRRSSGGCRKRFHACGPTL